MKTINIDKIKTKGNCIAKDIEKLAEIAAMYNGDFPTSTDEEDAAYVEDMMEMIQDAERLIAEIRREIEKKTAN